jgi:uncharacterized membrane protein
MKTSTSRSVSFALIAVSFIAAFYFYPQFPEQVITHWNLAGQPDGYSSAAFAAFFIPILSLILYVLLKLLPKIDPRREQYEKFKPTYNLIVTVLILFLTCIHFLVAYSGIGYDLPIHIIVPIMVGLLFIILGKYLRNVKNNWFIGVRNPWTLSNEKVWDRTHHFTGKVFVVAGICFLLIGLLPAELITPIFIAIIAGIIIIPNIYSYIAWKANSTGN